MNFVGCRDTQKVSLFLKTFEAMNGFKSMEQPHEVRHGGRAKWVMKRTL